jgi:hypothetical protein
MDRYNDPEALLSVLRLMIIRRAIVPHERTGQ